MEKISKNVENYVECENEYLNSLNDNNLWDYSQKVAMKKGFGVRNNIVAKLNRYLYEPLFSVAFIEHLIGNYKDPNRKAEVKFPICCKILFNSGHKACGYPVNVCVLIVDKWITKKFGPIQTSLSGMKKYPQSFIDWINRNYPPTNWVLTHQK